MTTTLLTAPTSTQCDYPYMATCGLETVAWADTLDDLIREVEPIFEANANQSVALWKMPGQMVGCVDLDGRLHLFDGRPRHWVLVDLALDDGRPGSPATARRVLGVYDSPREAGEAQSDHWDGSGAQRLRVVETAG